MDQGRRLDYFIFICFFVIYVQTINWDYICRPKFLELHYYRPMRRKVPKTRMEDTGDGLMPVIDVDVPEEFLEPRVETVVYYIPNVWTCMPNGEQWEEIRQQYKKQLAGIMCPPPPPPPPPSPSLSSPSQSSSSLSSFPAVVMLPANKDSSTEVDCAINVSASTETVDDDIQDEEDWNGNEIEVSNGDKSDSVNQPTHYSKLVVSAMKIAEIKKELELRKLKSRGLMVQLKVRLQAALDKEETQDRCKVPSTTDTVCAVTTTTSTSTTTIVTSTSTTPCPSLKSPMSNFLTEDQKKEIKKLYTLPDRPEIIVHQNKKMMVKDMKIRTMSLHSLLSYYDKTLEENTYELAIFAKQFLDMLRRDAVFNIYKSLVVASDSDLDNYGQSTNTSKSMVTTSKRTVDKSLLFSCCVLDRDKTGKISLDDLKILIEGLGICLSSDQLSSVLSKVKDCSKYLNYRQLTDKEVTDADITSLSNKDENEDLDYIKELAMGNKALFETEDSSIDISSIDQSEVERLKNDLDKSERSIQSMELAMVEIRETTKTSVSLAEQHAKEIKILKEKAAEYKTKYHKEQSRSDKCKREYERMLSEMKDLNKLTGGISERVTKCVSKSKENIDGNGKEAKTKSESKENGKGEKEDSVSNKRRRSGDSGEASEEKKIKTVNKENKVIVGSEDFDLSKPSDYDNIVLEETD